MRRLIELEVPLYLHTAVLEVTGTSVVVNYGGKVISLPAAMVIGAMGAEADTSLAKEIEGLVPEIHRIGDCAEPRHAAAATLDAAKIASKI